MACIYSQPSPHPLRYMTEVTTIVAKLAEKIDAKNGWKIWRSRALPFILGLAITLFVLLTKYHARFPIQYMKYLFILILNPIVFLTAATRAFCPPLPGLMNGEVTSVARSPGTVAEVTCDTWYHKFTRKPLTCIADSVNPAIGRWDGDVKCIGE